MIEINKLLKAPISENWVKKVALVALNEFKRKEKLKEISIALVKDKEVKKLNKIYRGIDRITDVLSFEDVNEIIICYPQAKRQAGEKRHSIKKEIKILLIHGLLHLAGYDHQTEKDALLMEEQEKKLLDKIINKK